MQAWFSIYLVVLFAPLAYFLVAARREQDPSRFQFRLAIPLLALCLLWQILPIFPRYAIPQGLISLVASIRRGSTLIAFAAGVSCSKSRTAGRSCRPVLGIVVGIVLTLLG